MKIKTAISITLLLAASVRALDADTYIYRVGPGSVQPVKALALGKDITDTGQPFYNTYSLAQPDTNYFLVKVTMKDGADPQYERFVGSTDLYQVMKLFEDGFIRPVVDNSKSFPTNKNWAVDVSSK